MNKKLIGLVIAALGLVVALFILVMSSRPEVDRGFIATPERALDAPLRWPNVPVSVAVAAGDEAWLDDLTFAVEQWNVLLDIEVLRVVGAGALAVASASVALAVDPKVLEGSTADEERVARRPHARLVTRGELIRTCDIALPPAVAAYAHADRRRALLRHELGHCIGLDHDDSSGSVMWHSDRAINGSALRSLATAADIARLRAVYLGRGSQPIKP